MKTSLLEKVIRKLQSPVLYTLGVIYEHFWEMAAALSSALRATLGICLFSLTFLCSGPTFISIGNLPGNVSNPLSQIKLH